MSYDKPLPVIDHDSAPYWETAGQGRVKTDNVEPMQIRSSIEMTFAKATDEVTFPYFKLAD